MKRAVRITTRAYDDIRAIVQWWGDNRSREQALRWYEGILKEIEELSSFPDRHALACEDVKTPFELRELHFGLSGSTTHRVLFRVRSDTVEVLAIRHVAQDDLPESELQ